MGSNSVDSLKCIPIPTKTEDVTVKWLSAVLNMNIDEKSFKLTGNVNAGVGFLSNMIRVTFLENIADGTTNEHFLIVKLLPASDADRQLVVSEKMDKSEICVYKEFIPELLKQIPSLEPYLCPMVFANIQEENPKKNSEYSSILILQDLKNEGYITKPFSKEELSAEELALTMEFMAKFHFGSPLIELHRKKTLPEIFDFFPEWYYPSNKQFILHKWFKDGFQYTKDVITNYVTNVNPSETKYGMEIIEHMLQPLAPHYRKIFDALILAGQRYPLAIHGDLWQNNVLTKIEPGNKTSIKIIDWQIAGYSDPAYDLAIFLCTSLLPDITMQKVEYYAKSYFDQLEAMYLEKERQGINLAKRRSWGEFWEALKTFGFSFVFSQWIMYSETLSASPENFPKNFACFKFFHFDAKITEFLTKRVIQNKES